MTGMILNLLRKNYLIKKENLHQINDEGELLELITGLIFPIDNKKIRDNKYIFHGSYTDIYNEHSFYVEKIEIGFNNSSMSSIEGFIINGEIANQNDKDEYLKKYSSYFKKNKLIKALNYIYNSNVFTSDPTYKEEQENVDKIELSEETKVMESIEYHLQILDSINHEKYILLKNKYEELLNSNDLLNINSLNLSTPQSKTFPLISAFAPSPTLLSIADEISHTVSHPFSKTFVTVFHAEAMSSHMLNPNGSTKETGLPFA